MPRHGDAVFVGHHIRVRLASRLLQVRRKRQEGDVLVLHGVDRNDDGTMNPDSLLDERQIPQEDEEHEVPDDGNPGCFAAARARQIVLQLDEQMGNARIQFSISCFPVVAIVEAELLGLWFRRRRWRRHRIPKWNLRNRHALDLGACHLDTKNTDGVASGIASDMLWARSAFTAKLTSILASFRAFGSSLFEHRLWCVNICKCEGSVLGRGASRGRGAAQIGIYRFVSPIAARPTFLPCSRMAATISRARARALRPSSSGTTGVDRSRTARRNDLSSA